MELDLVLFKIIAFKMISIFWDTLFILRQFLKLLLCKNNKCVSHCSSKLIASLPLSEDLLIYFFAGE